MNTERTPKSDRELWQSLALDHATAPAAISDMEFAAWLEGNLPETEAARIDAAVATNPEMRVAAMELAEILGKPLPPAPDRMAVRAKALVGFAAERRTTRSFGWLAGLLPSLDGGFGFQRGAMAGAAVMIAAVGFMMGGGLGESYAHEEYASAQPTVSANPLGVDTTGQLDDLFTDNI